MQRRELLRTATLGAVALVAGATSNGRSVGSTDVAIVREMTDTFRRLDNRYGGGRTRSTVTSYLGSEVEPLLRDGRARSTVRRELLSAAAELHQLAGWMAHDVGDTDAGQALLRHGLRLCREADDVTLAAELLAGMSHQAAFVRQPGIAVDLALAAVQMAQRSGSAALRAESAAMEAHGLALNGDTRGCVKAMQTAEKAMSAATGGGDTPPWLAYFDEAYLAAKFAHCFQDLGRPREAESFARRSLQMSDGYDRGRLFNRALLASTLADQRQVEEACASAGAALQMADTMHSARAVAYLVNAARRLLPFRSDDAVKLLLDRMAAAGIRLWPTGNQAHR